MLETTKKLVDAVNELKKLAIAETFDEDMIKNMTDKDLAAMQSTLKLFDAASELLIKEAEIMESMNRKLNIVLEKLEEES